MDFLKGEIERKKRAIAASEVLAPNQKYFKRGDLSAQQAAEYRKKYGPARPPSHRSPPRDEPAGPSTQPRVEGIPALPRVEVIRRLRERLEPILVYGETEDEACVRLRQIEMDEPEKVEGIRNDFKDAMNKVDQVYLEEVLKAQGGGEAEGSRKSKHEVQMYETDVTYDEIQEMVLKINKGDIPHDHKVVAEFIKLMLKMWGEELNGRDENLGQSVKGKIESGTYAQTRTYLKPLLRMLRKQTVTDDIRDSLLKMIRFALEREYIFCNEAYMEMAIGNAPWPIGVTNAGIHARPARENIYSKHVAHVLNDETQRKYIQGLKRLMTKAQQYFPTDPSRSIDYTRKEDT